MSRISPNMWLGIINVMPLILLLKNRFNSMTFEQILTAFSFYSLSFVTDKKHIVYYSRSMPQMYFQLFNYTIYPQRHFLQPADLLTQSNPLISRPASQLPLRAAYFTYLGGTLFLLTYIFFLESLFFSLPHPHFLECIREHSF